MIITQQLVSTHAPSISAVLEVWRARWPHSGVLALLPEKESAQVAVLQQVASHLQVPLVGAIFPVLITDEGFRDEGVWLLCLETMPACFLLERMQEDGSQRLASAIAAVLPAAPPGDHPSHTLLTIFDAMVPNIASLMDEMSLQLPAAPLYVGANAGSETFQPMPCLFDGERLIGDGVLALLLPDQPRPIVQHDYPVSKSLMRATSAEGNRIVTIDDRPAFEVYQEVIAAEYGVALTKENFYEHAVHFPFGVVMAIDVLVRIPVALGDNNALVCVGEIPPNSMLRLLRAPSLEASTCVTSICSALQGQRDASQPVTLLTFYCAGRRMHFGPAASQELAQLRAQSGCTALAGALSLGEIDSNEDFNIPRFHNAAIVCLPQVQA